MCGIAGIRRYGKDPITSDQLEMMLVTLEARGLDASGIALLTDGKLYIHKDDVPAWKFVADPAWDEFLHEHLTDETTVAMVHTRAVPTGAPGNPRDNKNNHPITDGEVAIIHNGGVSNHEDVFKQLKTPRAADTDSDAIRAFVRVHGIQPETIRKMNKDFNGAIAAAVLDTRQPDKLLILRSGSPLVMAKVGTNLVWGSNKEVIHKMSRPWERWLNMWVATNKSPMQIVATPKDVGLIYGPNGLEFHSEFKSCLNYVQPDYTRQRTEYVVRQAKFDAEFRKTKFAASPKKAQRVIEKRGNQERVYYICRNQECLAKSYIPPDMEAKGVSLSRFKCPNCETPMEEAGLALLN